MQEKREQARAEAAARQAERAEVAVRQAEAAARKERAAEVIPWLRQLGFRADEAQRGAAACEHLADEPLEERVRVALASLGKAPKRRPSGEPSGARSHGSPGMSQTHRAEDGVGSTQHFAAAVAPIP